MSKLKQLRDNKAQKHTTAVALIDAANTGNRSLKADEQLQYDALIAEIEQLNRDIANEERALQLRAELALGGMPAGQTTSEQDERDFSKFSIARGLRMLAAGKPLDGVEAEVDQLAKRSAASAGIKAEGGFTVPAELPVARRGQSATGQTTTPGDQGGVFVETRVNALIEALWSRNWLSLVNATRLSGLVGNQTFPVQLTKPASESVTEIAGLTDQEILFGSINMSPNRRGTTIPISKQLMLQTSYDIEAFVMDQIRRSLDYKLNADSITTLLAAITSGNGNLLSLGINGGSPTWANIVGLETLISAADADRDSMYYLTNPKVRGKLKTTEKFSGPSGQPIWTGGITPLNEYPAVVSNIVPSNLTKGTASGIASAIVFGNFRDLYVGMWGGVDFVVDPYTLAKNAEVQITANMFWDVEVARAASFAGVKDALTT